MFVPDIIRVATVAPIRNSVHSSLSVVISMAQADPNSFVSRKVFLKHKVKSIEILSAVQYRICLAQHLVWWHSCSGFERTSLHAGWTLCIRIIRVPNKDKPWFDDQYRRAFGLLKQEAHLRWTRDRYQVTGKSLLSDKWKLMKPTQRPSMSLVTDTGMFLLMPSPLINGGTFFSLQCSYRVRHCPGLLVGGVDWCW